MDQVQSLCLVRWNLERGQQKERKVRKVNKATFEELFPNTGKAHFKPHPSPRMLPL